MASLFYQINPDRNTPWNDLSLLPIIDESLYRQPEILEQLGGANKQVSASNSAPRLTIFPLMVML